MKILSGDIGGTKTLLRLSEWNGTQFHHYPAVRFTSTEWNGLTPILEQFLTAAPLQPEIACFALAGPINGRHAQLTNLPWNDLDADTLARHFAIRQVSFLNDFQAIGYSISGLTESELSIIQPGYEIPKAPRIILGAGTGLGQSILIWSNGRYSPLASEGGHVDFAPINNEQELLAQFLRARFGHVSYERIISGPGLIAIDYFLRGSLLPTTGDQDLAALISSNALTAQDPIAVQSLRIFVQIYAQQAGNFALSCLARGGVYLAGGITPKILPFLTDGEFIRTFRAKGRMERLLIDFPIRVILHPAAGLLGAAFAAIHQDN